MLLGPTSPPTTPAMSPSPGTLGARWRPPGRSAGDDDLAGDLAVVEVADEGQGVGQGGGGLHLDLEGAGGGLVGQVGHVLDTLGGGDAAEDPEAEDGDPLV